MATIVEHRKTDLDGMEQGSGSGEKTAQLPVELELAGHHQPSGLEVSTMCKSLYRPINWLSAR
jgi:hypothetical protein